MTTTPPHPEPARHALADAAIDHAITVFETAAAPPAGPDTPPAPPVAGLHWTADHPDHTAPTAPIGDQPCGPGWYVRGWTHRHQHPTPHLEHVTFHVPTQLDPDGRDITERLAVDLAHLLNRVEADGTGAAREHRPRATTPTPPPADVADVADVDGAAVVVEFAPRRDRHR